MSAHDSGQAPLHEDRWIIETVYRHIPKPASVEQVAAQLLRDVGRYYPHDMIAAVIGDLR